MDARAKGEGGGTDFACAGDGIGVVLGGGKRLACGSAGIAGVVGRRGLGMSRAGIVGGGRLSGDYQGSELAVRRARRADGACLQYLQLENITINRGHRQSICRALVFLAPVAPLLPCAEHRIGRSA